VTHRALEHATQVPDAEYRQGDRLQGFVDYEQGRACAGWLQRQAGLLRASPHPSTRRGLFHPGLHLLRRLHRQPGCRPGSTLTAVPQRYLARHIPRRRCAPHGDHRPLARAGCRVRHSGPALHQTEIDAGRGCQQGPERRGEPYQTVAQLTSPRRDAYTKAHRAYVDEDLAFCVSHGLAAHRPLGSTMRARLRA
jgi:hypothetical protein